MCIHIYIYIYIYFPLTAKLNHPYIRQINKKPWYSKNLKAFASNIFHWQQFSPYIIKEIKSSIQLFLHLTYIEMCTFVCRLVDPFNCNKSNSQLVNLYTVYISNIEATQYFSLILWYEYWGGGIIWHIAVLILLLTWVLTEHRWVTYAHIYIYYCTHIKLTWSILVLLYIYDWVIVTLTSLCIC